MPRPGRPRDILAEDNLAQRVADEREARGWTNDGLAKRMTDVGCPMSGSTIFKIEKGTPKRRGISVDELVAFSRVFGIPVDALLLPPEIARRERLAPKVLAVVDAWKRVDEAERQRTEATQSLLEVLGDDDELRALAVEVFDGLDEDLPMTNWLRRIIASATEYGAKLDGDVDIIGMESGPDGRIVIHLSDGNDIETEGEQK